MGDECSRANGNLEFSRLGLSKQEAVRIFGGAGVIIHNGAGVSHLKAFQALKRANLEYKKELIEMCLPRPFPVYFDGWCYTFLGKRNNWGGIISAPNGWFRWLHHLKMV